MITVLKILAAPVALVLAVVVAFCRFILLVSDVVLGIVSVLIAIPAIFMFMAGATILGIILIAVAFLFSPFVIPALARRLVGLLGGARDALRRFRRS